MEYDFKGYVNEMVRELEEQIAREEATMTEEEKAADELRKKAFCEKMIKLVKEKYP